MSPSPANPCAGHRPYHPLMLSAVLSSPVPPPAPPPALTPPAPGAEVFRGHHFVMVARFLFGSAVVPDSAGAPAPDQPEMWLQRALECRWAGASAAAAGDTPSLPPVPVLSSPATFARWLPWALEASANLCIDSRLRTPFGKPIQTFEAIERGIKALLVEAGRGAAGYDPQSLRTRADALLHFLWVQVAPPAACLLLLIYRAGTDSSATWPMRASATRRCRHQSLSGRGSSFAPIAKLAKTGWPGSDPLRCASPHLHRLPTPSGTAAVASQRCSGSSAAWRWPSCRPQCSRSNRRR